MNETTLVRSTPESVGISSRELLKMVQALEKSGTEMHGIMLCRHGKLILDGWWSPYTSKTIHICHSLGKSYVATAIGAACTEGILSVEDRIADLFAKEIEQLHLNTSGNLGKLKVKHLLTMSNGMSVHAQAGEKLVENYLTTPVDYEPGTRFMYNTAGSCMLAEIVRRVTGKSVLEYLTESVLKPIGCDLEHFRWMAFRGGLHPAPGVASCTENNLRLGMLYLQNGNWNGRQLIDQQWMKDATTKQIDNGQDGYGYQLWIYRTPDTFRFSGGHGQDCFMSRPHDMVLAINQAASEPHDMDQNFDILDQYLFCVPHPDHLEEDPEGYAALRNYMEQLSIPAPGSAVPHGNLEGWEGVYLRKAGNFHLQPELRPFGNINANRDFYTITNENVEKLEIHRCAEGFRLTMNDQLSVIARLDGKWIPHFAQSAMPAYDQSCATVIAEKDQLEITQWFFQTCFKTKLWIIRTGDELHIKVRKERLHDDWAYIWSEAIMQREQQ